MWTQEALNRERLPPQTCRWDVRHVKRVSLKKQTTEEKPSIVPLTD